MTIKTLGFIGIGNMGTRMTPHISATGIPHHIFDLNEAACRDLARAHNNIVAATEALMIDTRFGLDQEVMCDVINESTGMNSATKCNMKQHLISRKFSGDFA